MSGLVVETAGQTSAGALATVYGIVDEARMDSQDGRRLD